MNLTAVLYASLYDADNDGILLKTRCEVVCLRKCVWQVDYLFWKTIIITSPITPVILIINELVSSGGCPQAAVAGCLLHA